MKRPHFALPEIYDDSLSYYDVLRKLIKSMHVINDNLNKIPEQISNEAKAREQADGTLQTNIDNEAMARQEADNELRELISTSGGGVTEAQLNEEVTARQQADTVLDGKISELKGDLTNKIDKPTTSDNNKFPRAKNGNVEWVEQGLPTDEQTASAITNWLNEHPEATTTVQDGSLETTKFTEDAKLHILKDYVTPQMFGAKGDGITDDSDAIQNAVNNGNNIFFPNGSYKITRPIEINASGKCLFGYDKYHTLITCVNTDAFRLGKNSERCSIKSIAIFGDDTLHNCVVFNNNTVHWKFEDVWVRHFGRSFFLANNNGHVNNIYFLNCQLEDGGSNAIEFVNVATAQINNIIIENCNIADFSNSGLIVTGNNIKINGCTIQNCEIGIDINPSLSNDSTKNDKSFSGISITSNYFELCYQSYIRISCGYVDSTVMFGNGLLILNNYGSYTYKEGISTEEKETYDTYACVEIKNLSGNIYDTYNVSNGGVLSSLLYACNKFGLKIDSKKLIDGGDILTADSIVFADGVGGNTNQSYSNVPYTLLNMANATVNSKYNFVKDIIKMYNAYYPSDSIVDYDSVTSGSSSNFLIEIPYNGIQSIELPMHFYSTESYTIQVFAYGKDGVKVNQYDVTKVAEIGDKVITLPNWAFTGNTLKGYVNTMSYTIIIKSNGKIQVKNPVVYRLA